MQRHAGTIFGIAHGQADASRLDIGNLSGDEARTRNAEEVGDFVTLGEGANRRQAQGHRVSRACCLFFEVIRYRPIEQATVVERIACWQAGHVGKARAFALDPIRTHAGQVRDQCDGAARGEAVGLGGRPPAAGVAHVDVPELHGAHARGA